MSFYALPTRRRRGEVVDLPRSRDRLVEERTRFPHSRAGARSEVVEEERTRFPPLPRRRPLRPPNPFPLLLLVEDNFAEETVVRTRINSAKTLASNAIESYRLSDVYRKNDRLR